MITNLGNLPEEELPPVLRWRHRIVEGGVEPALLLLHGEVEVLHPRRLERGRPGLAGGDAVHVSGRRLVVLWGRMVFMNLMVKMMST